MSGESALVSWRKLGIAIAAAGMLGATVVALGVAKAPIAHAQGATECGGKVTSYKGKYIAVGGTGRFLTFDGAGNVSGLLRPDGGLPPNTTYTADSTASAPLVITFANGSYGGSNGAADNSFASREQYCDDARDVNQVTSFGGTFKYSNRVNTVEDPLTFYLVQ